MYGRTLLQSCICLRAHGRHVLGPQVNTLQYLWYHLLFNALDLQLQFDTRLGRDRLHSSVQTRRQSGTGITSLQAGDPWGWASREEALGQLQSRPLEHSLLQAGLQAMPGFSDHTSTPFRPDRFAGRP